MAESNSQEGDRSGVALSPADVWLLLHALKRADAPAIGWDGNPLEPWTLAELEAKLRRALSPSAIASSEAGPAISLDSQMGRDLARAGITPLLTAELFDIGTMFDACARRGWGVELSLPLGATPETPASATVRVGSGDGDDGDAYVGLEEPAVALARALIGALVTTSDAESESSEELGDTTPLSTSGQIGDDRYEEHIIWSTAIQQGRKSTVIAKMAKDGWELVRDEGNRPGDRLVFRRRQNLPRD